MNDKLKAIELLYQIPKFNHNIIDHYHVAWKLFEGSLQTREEPGEDSKIIIHNVIDLNTCLPFNKNNIPSCIENGIINIINDEEKAYLEWEEDIYEEYEKHYEGLS